MNHKFMKRQDQSRSSIRCVAVSNNYLGSVPAGDLIVDLGVNGIIDSVVGLLRHTGIAGKLVHLYAKVN